MYSKFINYQSYFVCRELLEKMFEEQGEDVGIEVKVCLEVSLSEVDGTKSKCKIDLSDTFYNLKDIDSFLSKYKYVESVHYIYYSRKSTHLPDIYDLGNCYVIDEDANPARLFKLRGKYDRIYRYLEYPNGYFWESYAYNLDQRVYDLPKIYNKELAISKYLEIINSQKVLKELTS